MSADLALTNGKVLTMHPSQFCAEAVAIKKDRIAKVGTNEEINQWIGKKTAIINLNGKTVVPGFIDTHIHVADFGRFLTWLDLRDLTSLDEIKNSLRKRAHETPVGKWIIGHGLDQNRLKEKHLPSLSDLDLASPDNPVILYHQIGQICNVNSKALELAGITKQTNAPSDGIIDKNEETGELTGVLRDSATNLLWQVIPQPSEEDIVKAVGLACEKIVETGVTTVHWLITSSREVSILQTLLFKNKLPLKLFVIVPVNLFDNIAGLSALKAPGNDEIKIGGLEVSVDGYLAARTAALFQPYNDESSLSGKLLYAQDEMNKLVVKILKGGFQLVIHAAGDRAIDVALTAIEQSSIEALREKIRIRLDQAAVLNEGLLQRIRKERVIVSVQPNVINSEFTVWSAIKHLGTERAKLLYPVKKLLKKGIRVVGGSDCPMEPLSPLLGMQTAVTRAFFVGERVSVHEALRMYTIDAAYSSGEENIKGSIETGKLADLTVLSHDPRKVPPNEIEKITVEMTIVGGKVVYSKN